MGPLTECSPYDLTLVGVLLTAGVVFALLLFVSAPYGRHQRAGWGPTWPARWAWFVMESPAVLAFLGFYFTGTNALSLVPALLCTAWQFHYLYRVFLYPLRIRSSRRVPLSVVAMAMTFNVANAYLNALWLAELGSYPVTWLSDARFILGIVLFGVGLTVNRRADRALFQLRQTGGAEYRIPRGGLYDYVTCPNYFGEMVQWFGWALATWSMAGLAFALFTTANLVPRALSHHRWYRTRFPDYPSRRRALIPFML